MCNEYDFNIMSASAVLLLFAPRLFHYMPFAQTQKLPSTHLDTWIDCSYIRGRVAEGDEVRP